MASDSWRERCSLHHPLTDNQESCRETSADETKGLLLDDNEGAIDMTAEEEEMIRGEEKEEAEEEVD